MNTPTHKNDATVILPEVSRQLNGAHIKSLVSDGEVVSDASPSIELIDNINKTIRVGSILKHRYVIKDVLGSGGMGTVFRATDMRRQEAQDHQSDVAIKVLNDDFRDDPVLFVALQRETKKAQLLAHPNIITVYDFDKDGKNVFMVMELLEGKSLSRYIRDQSSGGMSFKNAWHIINGLILALAYAHKRNIIHSDFKPGNVFITHEGEVKVIDFGIACAAVMSDAKQYNETVFNARDLGALTPAYASLEMLQGKEPNPSDDVYALACVCYEILSGKHPYGKLSAQKALDVNLEVPVIRGLDRRTRLALTHALALKREQRTATVSDFLGAIEPKSIRPKVLGGFAIITVLAIAASFYYTFNELTFVDDRIIALTPEQKLKVDDFLELAQVHFEVGYLTAPSGSNALWAYRQALDIDPYNQVAQKGLKKIADLMEEKAAALFASGHYKESLEKIDEGLSAVPKHEELLELKEQIMMGMGAN